MSSYDRIPGRSPPTLGTGGLPSRLTVRAALDNPNLPSSRESMASVNAWRDHHQASMNASAGGNSLDDDSKSDLRLLEDSASSDGGLGDGNGGGTKRSRGDSQGGDSRDEFRHKRIITTPRQVAVLGEELRRNPFPSAERRDELAKELGMEPRRVQVWFQNRRQAERLARGRPPYNMMQPNSWYPGYPYPGYGPSMPQPPPGPYPPALAMTGDPSVDILIPYGPRRTSIMPPPPQGDSLMGGGGSMRGSLASRSAANSHAAASYRPANDAFDEYRRREYSEHQGGHDSLGGLDYDMRFGPSGPTTLAQDLAAMEENNKPSRHDRLGGGSRAGGSGAVNTMSEDSARSLSSRSHLQPFQSALSSELSLPPPSTLNRASGLPSLSQSVEDPFRLPLPKISTLSRSTGLRSSPPTAMTSSGGSPFDSSQTLPPPRSDSNRGSSGRSIGRLPSLSQALEMHPELSPDPTSFRYPPGYEQSLLLQGGGFPALQSGQGGLRRRRSLSRMNESSGSGLGRSPFGGSSQLGGAISFSGLPPLQPFSELERGLQPLGDTFRSPAPPRTSGNFGPNPLMASHFQNHTSLRRMPSDVAIQSSIRRQSLRDSEMARDDYAPSSSQYGL